MIWIAIRMLTGDPQKFFGLVFGIAFSTLLITQQLTIFVNLLNLGAAGVYNNGNGEVFVMDPASVTTDVTYPMPSTALDAVRSVEGVDWAVPQLRSAAAVRTAQGDLEQVVIVGVDDATLTGMPKRLVEGDKSDLRTPDTVMVDDVGATRMFPGLDPMGQVLELNDQRVVIGGITDTVPGFASTAVFYTTYSRALRYIPGTRNRMSLVIAQPVAGITPSQLVDKIEAETGLKGRTREEFTRDGIDFIIANTGIPFNFGITVALGFVVGVAIVGLTFSLFIRDNIKQFGALKAIGVTNRQIRKMVAAQAGLVGFIGYGFGVLATVGTMWAFSSNPFFKGFFVPWQVPLISLAAVIVILALTALLALRTVFNTEPAAVFR
ncbi:ABC transporter permease [Qipengyuania sphaerica]|uniref:ABC transporter permease n=1 Tax=Qipengyuania sphaerica TaxID=2867243 RepID=UPI001C8832C7|nr:ABC transporter permease [Qipengyuania sphaerica]MBX7539693.1 ABC transporter permease [Qipengyuania sphaerica]